MRKSYNTDIAKEVKEQRKILPYTVTPIANLAAWKAEQAEKQAKWDAGRSDRYQSAKTRAVAIIQGGKASEDKNDKIYNQYKHSQKALVYKDAAVYENGKRQYYPKLSLFQRILNYFLDIKF